MYADRLTNNIIHSCITDAHRRETAIKQLNFRVPESLLDAVDTYANERDETVSGAARNLLEQGVEHARRTSELDRVRSEYERELDERDARIRELKGKLMAANQRIDNANEAIETSREIVRMRERERSIGERKARANIFTRMWWTVRGVPNTSSNPGNDT